MTLPLTESERTAWQSALTMADTLRSLVSQEVNPMTGLSAGDFLVLGRLDAAPEHRLAGLKALAAKLGWSASRLSHHLKRMSRRGLVDLGHAEATGQLVISATDAGRETMRTARVLHAAAVRRHFLSVLTEDELRMLTEIAQKINRQTGVSHL